MVVDAARLGPACAAHQGPPFLAGWGHERLPDPGRAPGAGPDAGKVVAALRIHHDRLAALVDRLDEAALTGPSDAAEWRVCDVPSHLASGAGIMLPAVAAAGVAPAALWPPPLS